MAAPGPAAALGGAGAAAPEAGAASTRSRGKALTVAQSRQAALGIKAAAPPTLAESITALHRLFSEAPPSQELHVLDEFAIPAFAIQPAVVPNFDIKSVKESLDKVMDENLRALIQLPTEKDDIAEVKTATEEEEEDGHIAVSIPVGSSANYLLNPNLLSNVKDSYSADLSAGDVPIYFFIITNFGHASIIIYSMGVLYSVGLGLNYGSWAARSATPRLESAFTGRSDFLADGVLLSPDFLVKPAALHPTKGTPFNYKIIDIGLFKTKHVERILSLTSKSTTTTAHFDKIEPYNYQFSHFEIDIKKKYMYLSSAKIAEITGDFYNCVSFAQTIFKERVDCTIGMVGPVDPFRCRSRSGSVAKVRGLFEEYMEDYISGAKLSRTFPRLDSVVAGGGRRRRSRRNKMHRRSKVSRRYRR